MSAFDYVYQELGIQCGLAWLTSPFGITAIVVSVVLAFLGTFAWNAKADTCEYGHESEAECSQSGCPCGHRDGPFEDGGL